MPNDRRALLVAAGLVFLGCGLLTVPGAFARWWLTQDAVEHLAIANALASGAGFVDPVLWIYPHDGPVPYPAVALRAPIVSLLAAVPLASGATLGTTITLHALLASAIAGSLVFAARRCGASTTTAFAAAIVFATTPAWIGISLHVWTEAVALAAFIAVLMTLRGAVDSTSGALVCAAATFLASLCRPNLIALGAAVLVAGIVELASDPRRRSRRPLVVYVGALALASLAYRSAGSALFGETPNARYSALFTALTTADVWDYARGRPTLAAFLADQAGSLLSRTHTAFADLLKVLLLEPTYHGLGWLALPGFAAAWWPRPRGAGPPDPGRLERRFAALSGLGLAAIAILYLDFDRVRFPVFTALAASLCGFVWLERSFALGIAGRVTRSLRRSSDGRFVRFDAGQVGILLVVAVPLLATLPESIERTAQWSSLHRTRGTEERLWPAMDARIRPLCRSLPPEAVVASVDPWTTHLWCGNASLMLPRDIGREGILERFLERERPGLLIASIDEVRLRGDKTRLRPIAEHDDLVVYAVIGGDGAARPRTWHAPRPLACAGRPAGCGSRPPDSRGKRSSSRS
jgi:hypothetical protein